MNLSAATVLFSISSASALSSYLDMLSFEAPPAPANEAGVSNYLDNISGAQEQVPALVTALEQAAPAATTTPPAPTSGDYLSALNGSGSSGSVGGTGSTSYLDTMASAPNGASASLGGPGLTSYLDALPATVSSGPSGSGLTSYLDNMGGGAPVAPAATATPAATAANAAPAAGDYLGALNTGSQNLSGAGLTTYLDALPPGTRAVGGPGLTGYLEALPPSLRAVASGRGLSGYLDALSADGGVPGSAVEAFLESVYQKIMELPDDGSRVVSGDAMTFAKADGPYAMSFVKK